MNIWWKYEGGRLIKSPIPRAGWNMTEAKHIDDVIPDGEGGVKVKTLEEKLEEARKEKLEELKKNYKAAILETDARVLQYQKRKELGILTQDDEMDYCEALQLYKSLTEQYRKKKAEIESLTNLDTLRNYDTTFANTVTK